MKDILISVRPRFVKSILEGSKRVEIRKRSLRVQEGTRLWIYSTKPVGRIEALAIVDSVESGCPDDIWEEVEKLAGITEGEYRAYLNGSARVVVIRLRDVRKLGDALDLRVIRAVVGEFHPPQFAKWLKEGAPLLSLLRESLQEELPSSSSGTSLTDETEEPDRMM